MSMNSTFRTAVLQVKCSVCHRGNGHWCRDEKGKAILPHRERSRAAIKLLWSPFIETKPEGIL